VSQDNYNSVTGEKVQLKKGEALNVITDWRPGYHGINPQSTLNFHEGSRTFTFKVTESKVSKWIANVEAYKSSSGIVLNNEDYNYIKNNITVQNIGVIHGLSFKSWKNTGAIVGKLIDELNKKNENLQGKEQKINSCLKVTSVVKNYESSKRGFSFFIFVTIIMGFLFFIAGGSVLFFKQYTELNNDKRRFIKLFKVGISEKEIKAIIAKELRVTFFTPLIMGNFLGYCLIYFLTHLFGGEGIIKEFMTNATYVVIIYFLFQAVFYNITKRKYTNEILKAL